MILKVQWKEIEDQIKYLKINPNHIFKDTVMDDWLNHAAYHCKCTYFGRPTDEEDVDETTLDQDKWDNLLLKDFDLAAWRDICEDEFYPHSINHFINERPIEAIEKLKPIIDEIINGFKILYSDSRLFFESLYEYINDGFKTTNRYFDLTQEQQKEYEILRCNRAVLQDYINKN